MRSQITQEKTLGSVNLVRHPSSVWAKTITRKNTTKRKSPTTFINREHISKPERDPLFL